MSDTQMWQMGIYVHRAVAVAVAGCLAGKKSKLKYLDEPLSIIAEREAKLDRYYKQIGTDKDIEKFKVFVEVFNANKDLREKERGGN